MNRRCTFIGVCLGVVMHFTSVIATAQDRFALVGHASCASATCHGGSIDRGPAWNHSLSQWTIHDPHAGAARLLRREVSQQMVERLEPGAPLDAQRYDNVLRRRCISCHATATPADCAPRGRLDDEFLAAGVSCEACHGAAEKWLEPHLRSDWQGPERFSSKTGMRDTESVIGRAETCVRCHIGSRTADGLVRDMNHDLIASGHPALRFDLLLYNESLPWHWSKSNASEVEFDSSAMRVRAVGRAINLAAAAQLAGERANDHRRGPGVPWPEFAEYDCFACHQSISAREYLLPSSQVKRSPLHISDGLPLWNSWHAINQLPREKLLLKALSPHRSDPATIVKSVPRVIADQRQLANRAMASKPDPQTSIRALLTTLDAEGVFDWHEAAILYLDLEAILRDQSAQTSEDTPLATERLRRLRETIEPLLRFNRPSSELPSELPKEPGKPSSENSATILPSEDPVVPSSMSLNDANGPPEIQSSAIQSPAYQSPVTFDTRKFRRAVLAMMRAAAAHDEPATTPSQP